MATQQDGDAERVPLSNHALASMLAAQVAENKALLARLTWSNGELRKLETELREILALVKERNDSDEASTD